jgi:hypothetical protein
LAYVVKTTSGGTSFKAGVLLVVARRGTFGDISERFDLVSPAKRSNHKLGLSNSPALREGSVGVKDESHDTLWRCIFSGTAEIEGSGLSGCECPRDGGDSGSSGDAEHGQSCQDGRSPSVNRKGGQSSMAWLPYRNESIAYFILSIGMG